MRKAEVVILACLVAQIGALKILMAGDYSYDGRNWFKSVADRLISNEETDHVVYFLTTDLALGQEEMTEGNERFVQIGIGKHDFRVDESVTIEENERNHDLQAARAYFERESFLQKLRSHEFSVGIGDLSLADSLLFRALDELPSVKLSEEDIEISTMQRLNMPVLSSAYPSRQTWSMFHHTELPEPGSFFYRYANFKQYYLNMYERYMLVQEMRSIVPEERLIDDYDQESAVIIGQGATAGLYQAIMVKPRNIKSVYPLTRERQTIFVPDYLEKETGLVVFNIEADREDDLMQRPAQLASQRILMGECMSKGLGVVVIAPERIATQIREKFLEWVDLRIWIIETDRPHDLKIVNRSNESQLIVWIGACSQANLLSAIGEHEAVLIGYAKGQTNILTSVQKYTCHKVNEYVVGTSSMKEGDLSSISTGLLVTLLDPAQQITKEVRGRVAFYSHILLAQGESSQDLEYWLDYVTEFGTAHLMPIYDGMSVLKYNNFEVWALLIVLLIAPIICLCALCNLLCDDAKKPRRDEGEVTEVDGETKVKQE